VVLLSDPGFRQTAAEQRAATAAATASIASGRRTKSEYVFRFHLLKVVPTASAGYKDRTKSCLPGTRFEWARNGCEDCPQGRFQPFSGQHSCYVCTHTPCNAGGV
jgi:hypothetical protein